MLSAASSISAGEEIETTLVFLGDAIYPPYSGGVSRVRASGTMRISAGKWPANSPSTWT
jgi:hypothetical protein